MRSVRDCFCVHRLKTLLNDCSGLPVNFECCCVVWFKSHRHWPRLSEVVGGNLHYQLPKVIPAGSPFRWEGR